MKILWLKYLDRLRSSFWFLPTLMATLAIISAIVSVWLDETLPQDTVRGLHWVYGGGAEGAAVMLGAVASSMMTITGLVFSMILVVLSLLSSQFGPRLLRSFMRDTVNQLVLGTFVATFLFCLLVLRTIRRAEEHLFVPHISVTVGLLFGLLSIGVLIYFIHHVAVSMQATAIVTRIANELANGIDRLFPETVGEPSVPATPATTAPADFDDEAKAIISTEEGYIETIDADALLALAVRSEAVIRIERRPGQYASRGETIASILVRAPATQIPTEAIAAAFSYGGERTNVQDVEFTMMQLVEIAVRALSPGINDPFTALTCIDRLGSALRRVMARQLPSPYRLDHSAQLRLIVHPITYVALIEQAFNQIRQYGRTNTAVTLRLLEAIASIVPVARGDVERAELLRQAEMIERGARDGLPEPNDYADVSRRYRALVEGTIVADSKGALNE